MLKANYRQGRDDDSDSEGRGDGTLAKTEAEKENDTKWVSFSFFLEKVLKILFPLIFC